MKDNFTLSISDNIIPGYFALHGNAIPCGPCRRRIVLLSHGVRLAPHPDVSSRFHRDSIWINFSHS